jgi:hypothetical protein
VDPLVGVTLAFLEKVTLTPDDVTPADVAAVREAGGSDQAIADALHVCFVFNMIDRLADALGWHVQTLEEFEQDAGFLLKRGYELVGPVRRRALARSR